MTRALPFLLLSVGALIVTACSDDEYIATNETLGGGGAPSGGGASTGGAATGGATGGGPAGGGAAGESGSSGQSGAAGQAGSAGSGGGGGECTPGQKQDVGTCEKCGTSRRTCDASGAWGAPVCEDQKACNPGDKSTTGCTDPCAEKTCGATCSFGTCGLKTGAKCLYESGTNYNCCGTDHWQFCNKDTCDWYACQPCSAGSSCLNLC